MDKIDRLLDALEHPDSYSPNEIQTMLHDPEVKEVFDLLDKTKSSLQHIDSPDIDAEWKRFEKKNRDCVTVKRSWFTTLFSRNAAASIAIAIASFTAVAAIVGVGFHHIDSNDGAMAQEAEQIASGMVVVAAADPDSAKTVSISDEAIPEIVVFDDTTLETILTEVAEYYDGKVEFNNEAAKALRLYFRWNQTLTLDEVIDRLNNFEQIKLTVKDRTIKVD